jgi:hypothetical protein
MVTMIVFKPAARYPADPRAVFILAMSVFSGLTSLALNSAPDSLDALLPTWVVMVWGVLLTIGSVVTLVGMSRQTVGGIVTEQIGSVMVAATTIFYAVLALRELGLDALQGVGIILAWGLSCLLRWVQLQILINNAAKRAAKRKYLEAMEVEFQRREQSRQQHERRAHDREHTDWRMNP